MNGYKLMAESYRKLSEAGKLSAEVANKEIRVFDFLAECDETDICRLINSGAFNDIIKGYVKACAEEAGFDPDQVAQLQDSIRWVLDTRTASEVL